MPFYANGSEAKAYVIEVNAENGDLVDLRYFCYSHAPYDGTHDVYLGWPGYDWPDYCVYCEVCSGLLNVGQDCECEGEQHIIQTLVAGGWSESYARERLDSLKAKRATQ